METACPESAALVAVGAYGRREAFPYSAAEAVVLLDHDCPAEPVKISLAVFAQSLRSAGLRLNYTVRTPAQCLDGREPVNLLDRRFLAGAAGLNERLESRLPALLARQARDLRQLLAQTARARHAQHGDTPRLLRPDVQEAPGGLRDVALVGRLARLNPDQDPPPEDFTAAAEFLAAARCFLHYRAGRDCNLLDAEAQDSLSRAPFAGGIGISAWMRRYFRQARLVYREARRALDSAERTQHPILESFRDSRTRLSNAEFTVTRDRLFLRSPSQLDRDPELVMRAAGFVARHGVPLAHETERRLEGARAAFARWCAARPAWPALKTILSLPYAVASLRALENCGLLAALIPGWLAIEDLPLAGGEHRYTADEHTLRAMESAEPVRNASGPGGARFPELLSEVDQRALPMAALLFHQLGADAAGEALRRLEAPAAERAEVLFLIEHRNDLANAGAGRDIGHPATARLVAGSAGTVERLKMLAVVAYARLCAAGGDATGRRIEQLRRAYLAAYHELTRELETGRIQQVPDYLAGRTAIAADFIRGFPVRYLRARSPEEIERHVRLFEESRHTGVAARLEPAEGAWRAVVVARDRPCLFASFAGAISSFGLNILKAEAFSNAAGVVLDTFEFADPERLLETNPAETERLQSLLRRVALGKTDARRFLRDAQPGGPRKRAVAPRVTFDPTSCETATLAEIVAEDRPGLLYKLAMVFSSHSCNIDVVLVDTKGGRAIDVFYVAFHGRGLPEELQDVLKDRLLAAC